MKSATVGIRQLRDQLSRHLSAVAAGGELTVTDHGRPIARIVPVGASRLDQLIDDGRVLLPANGGGPLPKRQGGGPVSDLIER